MTETILEEKNKNFKLEFTGNWFMDAGILGFVNLMEEVYGWDLKELQNRIDENEELIYYGYFPFAYLFGWLKDRKENVSYQLIREIKEYFEKNTFQSSNNILDKAWNLFVSKLYEEKWVKDKSSLISRNNAYSRNKIKPHFNNSDYLKLIEKREKIIDDLLSIEEYKSKIKSLLKKKKEIKELEYEDIITLIGSNDKNNDTSFDQKIEELKRKNIELEEFLGLKWKEKVINDSQEFKRDESKFYRVPIDSGFYKNFLFFNYFYGNIEQRESFHSLISFNVDSEDMLTKIDKTINKFLPSETEFSNINYVLFSSKNFKDLHLRFFVYLLCFTSSFEYFPNLGNTLFYSNNLEMTYKINKRLKISKININNSDKLLRTTFVEIIDFLIEHQSIWSIENMCLITYGRLDNQSQEDIEFIGINKLCGNVLLDEQIRSALNRIINLGPNRDKNRIWLLGEFAKNKPLYPIIINHVISAINTRNKKVKIYINVNASLYSLSIDANIKELTTENSLFSQDFFKADYGDIVQAIKKSVNSMSMAKNAVNGLFQDENERKGIIYELLSALKGKDRNNFINILAKALVAKDGKGKDKLIDWYISKYMVKNDKTWENYALPLVMGLVVKND